MLATYKLDDNGLWRIEKNNFVFWAENMSEACVLAMILDSYRWN